MGRSLNSETVHKYISPYVQRDRSYSEGGGTVGYHARGSPLGDIGLGHAISAAQEALVREKLLSNVDGKKIHASNETLDP